MAFVRGRRGLNIVGLTALSVLITVTVGPVDVVLVGGASSAVGFVAAQLSAPPRSATTSCCARSSSCRWRTARGSRRRREIGSLTAVYDCHRRDALDTSVAVGLPADRMVEIAAYAALEKLGVHNAERAARTAENLARLAADVTEGRLLFSVAQSFALDEVVTAFATMESSHAPGKIVVMH